MSGGGPVTRVRDAFCSSCGARYEDTRAYPRSCRACGAQVWANPIPVAVALVPVILEGRTGLLVVRRAIPPVGKLALVGGFVEEAESWQEGLVRELREEANLVVPAASVEPLWFASSEPRPNRILMFGRTAPVAAADLPPFVPNPEASERGVIFAPIELAFPLHTDAARRFFARREAAAPGGGAYLAV